MSRVPAPEFDKERLVVLPHAVHRARLRSDYFRGKDNEWVRREIATLIAQSLSQGQVYTRRPKQFRAPGGEQARYAGLPFWQRLVVAGRHGFVVDVAEAPKLTVITTLFAPR